MSNSFSDNVEHKNNWVDELSLSSRQPPKTIIWDYRDLDKLDTFWFMDVHYGHRECDESLFREKVDLVGEKQWPVADLGDLVENATRDSIGAGVYEQEEVVQYQMEKVIDIYEQIKDLIKVLQPGNHELRSWKSGGVNLTRIIGKLLGVPVGGAGVVHYVMVGGERYIGYSTHGGSGATTVGGKLNALMKLEKVMEADFFIQGHTHETIYKSREFFTFDKRSRRIIESRRHFINGGSALDYWNSYGQVKAYSPTTKGWPKVTFYGGKHEIKVSFV